MVYMHITVHVIPGKIEEFHKFWSANSLPVWERYGAKHIGSWNTFVGKGNEVTRLFAFDDMAHYERWQRYLSDDPEGQRLRQSVSAYLTDQFSKIIAPVSYSPLK